MYALEVNDLNKYYNQFIALENINFNIKQGDFVGLLGVNGAGKTSLISAISGASRFLGKIKIMGYDINTHTVNAKRKIGVVPQELAFDPFLTVKQTLKMQSGLYGVRNNQAWLDEIIERLYLTEKINSNTRALSGGMKRRLMIAQALVHKPPFIILDEPTAGVDVEIRQGLWNFITELHQKGHTILLTTHYLEEVEKLCDTIIMINKGKIISQTNKFDLMLKCEQLPTYLEVTTKDGQLDPSLRNIVCDQKDNVITLLLNNHEEIIKILTILQVANIKIENINIKKPNLEDVFIRTIHTF